jgi:hypothetical protein
MVKVLILTLAVIIGIAFLIKFSYVMYRRVLRENMDDVKYIQEETEVYREAKRMYEDAVAEERRKK